MGYRFGSGLRNGVLGSCMSEPGGGVHVGKVKSDGRVKNPKSVLFTRRERVRENRRSKLMRREKEPQERRSRALGGAEVRPSQPR